MESTDWIRIAAGAEDREIGPASTAVTVKLLIAKLEMPGARGAPSRIPIFGILCHS
jgi:hypothetical protein